MCGIAGFFISSGGAAFDFQDVARGMARRVAHRGPDDEGVWCDTRLGVALAHRRLSILDLSEAGHQPMASSCGRYIMVFNGEIYNHLTIRKELGNQAGSWRGNSDTETLLAAISVWGLEEAIKKSVGMFALALWDGREKALYLARDRVGEKPLYYGLQGRALLFASELKALKAHPNFKAEINRNAITLLLRYNYIPAPHSIYQGIFKLSPGSWVKITQDDVVKKHLPAPVSFWSLPGVAAEGQRNVFCGSEQDAVSELERLLKQSISEQMIADVPLGAFLSGGIDSSTVVALMQVQSSRPVQTFTIGFHEGNYDEAKNARAVASHLGTDHTELYVTPEQAMEVIPRLPSLYDEPFADVSQIPTFLVSELARRKVTVCLSGDGGDELFGGYNRYISGVGLWRRVGWMPSGVRRRFAAILEEISPSQWDKYFKRLGFLLPPNRQYRNPGDKMHKFANMLSAGKADEIYDRLVSHSSHPGQLVRGGIETESIINDAAFGTGLPGLENKMMCWDMISYLPDDILVKVDRAAMGVSLETRIPMLDHRLVEFAWTLPPKMKIQGGKGKWPLRRVLDGHVPRSLIERPKAGFSVPLDDWLRGPLRGWAENLLAQDKLDGQGFLNSAPVRLRWKEHLEGRGNWSNHLWGILMFQAWLDQEPSP